jgi:hypothetical protein
LLQVGSWDAFFQLPHDAFSSLSDPQRSALQKRVRDLPF